MQDKWWEGIEKRGDREEGAYIEKRGREVVWRQRGRGGERGGSLGNWK